VNNQPASSIRVGAGGVSVAMTNQTTGNLNAQMRTVFNIAHETGGVNAGRIFIPRDYHLQQYDGLARTMEDYRLTYSPFTNPKHLYDGAYFNRALTVVRNASDYGVPAAAKAVSFVAHVTCTNASGAAMRVYQESAKRD